MKRHLGILILVLLIVPACLKAEKSSKSIVGIWQLCIPQQDKQTVSVEKIYKIFDGEGNVVILNDDFAKNCVGLITMQAKYKIQSDTSYVEETTFNTNKAYIGAKSLIEYHFITSGNNEYLCSSYPAPDKKHRIGEVWRRVEKAPQKEF